MHSEVALTGEASLYGKYVEPLLHATEHARRALVHENAAEWARTKDELRTFGEGLHKNENLYRDEHRMQQKLEAMKLDKVDFRFK